MSQLIADRKDIDFVLHDQMQVESLSKYPRFSEFNRKIVDMIVTEARALAIKEILPTQKQGDEEGCEFKDGKVKVPESYHKAYKLFKEGEWVAMHEDTKWGGQGMPKAIAMAAGDYFNGANYSFMMYPGLTHGAGKLVEAFGTEEQKETFLRKMYSGEWTGTMLLTEPEAGSDVGALTATAVKNDDGTYSITGHKIFISSGEHDMAENIIHTVLARIEDAPSGTKGISLFLVPKIWVKENGELGDFNDVACIGIEKKLGIHGNSTCSLALGGKGQCRGLLLGQEHKGMRAMFLLMNEARLLVGLQGLACASASYMYAVKYAKERIQGKNILQLNDPEASSVPIIQHPDVRRQLMNMKVYVEGFRSLLYYIALLTDKSEITDDLVEKEKFQGIIEVLTPIAKGYVTEKAFDICSQGLQVFGGYGYIKDYPMEQLLRDCRITMIYEGTNGIQAMDLLGRKLNLKEGKPVLDLLGEMQITIANAKKIKGLNSLAEKFGTAMGKLGEVGLYMGSTANSPKVMNAFTLAYPFLEVCGDVVMAWMLLWRASLAASRLEKGAKKKDIAFYKGQINSADYFINVLLTITMGKMDAILIENNTVLEISEASF